jgi:hypothetical protein
LQVSEECQNCCYKTCFQKRKQKELVTKQQNNLK